MAVHDDATGLTERPEHAVPAGATVDAFAGGLIELVQFDDGRHRCGLEAALLGAAVAHDFSGTAVDLGAGTGAAGLIIAARCPDASVVLVDVDAPSLACASATLTRPENAAFADRVAIVCADVGSAETDRCAAGLRRDSADLVVANPPFHERRRASASPSAGRCSAHMLDRPGLQPWVRCAASVLRPGGRLVFVVAAALANDFLNCLDNRFGGAELVPVHPRADAPAHRVLIRATKASRAPLKLLPPLVLHGPEGSGYLPAVEAMLRGRRALEDVHVGW